MSSSLLRLRQEPFRLLFPLGALLAWAGVGCWLLFSVGASPAYRSVFHSMAQVQGFLTSFAAGVLLTFIPRRTRTEPPPLWLVCFAALAPVATTALAWTEQWAWSQLPWLALMAVLVGFAAVRARRAQALRQMPPGFVWVPFSIALGVLGVLVTGVPGAGTGSWLVLHDWGRGVVLQGVFTGLILGMGSVMLPVITRGMPPPDSSQAATQGGWSARAWHLAGVGLLFSSFVLEGYAPRAGYLLRAMVCAAALGLGAQLWKRPSLPGLHRWVAWVSSWLLPVGYLLVALFPVQRQLGLHVVFIGSFSALTLAVAVHVVLSHSGWLPQLVHRWRATALLAKLLGLALVFRVLVMVDPPRFQLWLGLSAAAFLLATVSWLGVVLRGLRAPPAPAAGS